MDDDDKHTDPGFGRDVGDGYREEQPGGANPSERRPDRVPGGEAAPGTKGDQDSDRGDGTGHPDAAGGEP